MPLSAPEQLAELKRGAVAVYTEQELLAKLERSNATGQPLRIKLGVDPTAPDIHLGHTVVLSMLRRFQDLGHHAVLIIGDFTALIGDPSGRDKTRPPTTAEEIEANAQTYLAQVRKVLLPERLEIRRNSEWLGKLDFREIIRLAAKMTVARILERDDFLERYKKGTPISLHEFLYPLMQAYDSVVIKADVELGGTDQTFNLLAGRGLMKEEGLEPQVALTTPLLVGVDGVEKMSKSLGNHIGIADEPNDMFGKIMSIPDSVLREYFNLLSTKTLPEVDNMLAPGKNPRDAKVELGREIVARFHGEQIAQKAVAHFEKVFSRREVPEEVPTLELQWKPNLTIIDVIKASNGTISGSKARTLVEQGAVTLGGTKIKDISTRITLDDNQKILKIGKKGGYWRMLLNVPAERG